MAHSPFLGRTHSLDESERVRSVAHLASNLLYPDRWMYTPSEFSIIRVLRSCGLYLLGLSLALIVSTATVSMGQQTLEVPMPQSQGTQSFVPQAQPTAPPIVPRSNNVQTIPAAPPPPVSSGQTEQPPETEPPPEAEQPAPPPPEPVLPAVLRGCWRGRVDELDRIQRLPGGPPIGPWMPKTYLLCYRRVGDGPFKLTFTEAGVEGTRIINTTGQLRVVATDGRSYATMRAFLHFDKLFSASTSAVDEETDLQCTIGPDGMQASGVVLGENDGASWFRAWWHTTFFHEPNPPY